LTSGGALLGVGSGAEEQFLADWPVV